MKSLRPFISQKNDHSEKKFLLKTLFVLSEAKKTTKGINPINRNGTFVKAKRF